MPWDTRSSSRVSEVTPATPQQQHSTAPAQGTDVSIYAVFVLQKLWRRLV
jgi:hypothetical protein